MTIRICLLAAACMLRAQESTVKPAELGELMPDRPGFTSPSPVVGRGVFQVETGYTYESARQNGVSTQTFTAPQALLRFGLTDSLELRLATNGYEWQSLKAASGAFAFTGPNDYQVSAKLRVVEQTEGSMRPEIAVTGGVSIPAHGSEFTSGGYDPQFTLAAFKDLPLHWSIAANANFASVTDPQGRFYSSGLSLKIARDLGPLGVFGEVYHTTLSRNDGSETVFDAGVWRNMGRNAQIDAEMGHTVAGSRPSWFASMGLVVRDPHRFLKPKE